ncbi:uncharacterized protein G2W53_026802 [Senna tora]|uniref:Uncharacterized protein n=1 Tax=Senna tora TaxID=362788 RepID=A0A834WG02_9FABA|nr:uncharacterized protein G2W53_026802 [Senna tora]
MALGGLGFGERVCVEVRWWLSVCRGGFGLEDWRLSDLERGEKNREERVKENRGKEWFTERLGVWCCWAMASGVAMETHPLATGKSEA